MENTKIPSMGLICGYLLIVPASFVRILLECSTAGTQKTTLSQTDHVFKFRDSEQLRAKAPNRCALAFPGLKAWVIKVK